MRDRLPKARVDDLHVEDLPGELIVYDLARHRAHRSLQLGRSTPHREVVSSSTCDSTEAGTRIARCPMQRSTGYFGMRNAAPGGLRRLRWASRFMTLLRSGCNRRTSSRSSAGVL